LLSSSDYYCFHFLLCLFSEAEPVEIIFTNHDLLTGVMPFANGGYYNYGRLLYKAG